MLSILSSLLCILFFLTLALATDLPPPTAGSGTSARGHNFTVRKQSAQLCDTGSAHWTGTIQVTPEKSLFFCELSKVIKKPNHFAEGKKGSSKAGIVLLMIP
jgi:hypothetical protein